MLKQSGWIIAAAWAVAVCGAAAGGADASGGSSAPPGDLGAAGATTDATGGGGRSDTGVGGSPVEADASPTAPDGAPPDLGADAAVADPCAPNPCENGGGCSAVDGAATCACAAGFEGPTCAIDTDDCAVAPCQNGGVCADQVNGFTCECAAGFNGVLCETDVDDCAAAPCQHGGVCTDQVNGFACACAQDFGGVTCDVATLPAGFVRIEPGVFQMGSPAEEAGRSDLRWELQHEVRITRAFALKATEVTQGEWQAVMGDNPSGSQGCGPDCPVESVSWFKSVAYCNALSLAEGRPRCYADAAGADYDRADANNQTMPTLRNGLLDCAGYRLPTEAEWEYAARAGTATASYNGAVGDVGCGLDASLDPIAWYCGNSGDTTHPVGGKSPNAWGLYDMLGNVFEWCHDLNEMYWDAPAVDPLGGESSFPLPDLAIVRGGTYNAVANGVRAAARGAGFLFGELPFYGFRPARSILP